MATEEKPRFGEAVGFLLSQLGYEVARRFGQLMRTVELEPRHFALMRAIEAAEGQPQNALGDFLRIPPSSLVVVIDHLEQRKLVERRPDPNDRRARLLYLTAEGKQVLKEATELAMGFEATVCRGFSAEERDRLIGQLFQVVDNLGLARGLHPATATGQPADGGERP